jgi:hypothetical protein
MWTKDQMHHHTDHTEHSQSQNPETERHYIAHTGSTTTPIPGISRKPEMLHDHTPRPASDESPIADDRIADDRIAGDRIAGERIARDIRDPRHQHRTRTSNIGADRR